MISIIIPVYNAEKYIRRCLRSIMTQTYSDYEVICVEDAGTDSSADILDELERLYPDRLHVIHNEINMGPGRSRDKALCSARGEYICYIDADDYILPDYLERYMNKMQEVKADVIIGGYRLDKAGSLTMHRVADNVWACVTYVTVWARLYSKEFIVKNGMRFEDLECLEDMYFNLTGYINRMRYCVIDYQGYIHYVNDHSVTAITRGSGNKDIAQYVMSAFDRLYSRYDAASLSATMRWTLEYAYAANMINALLVYSGKIGSEEMDRRVERFFSDLERRFPDYRVNPYLKGSGPSGQTARIRLGVSAVMQLHRLGLDKKLLGLLAG